ncbi:MAG TPA: DoxX family protein [Candidatus Bathyarchaeia archaeon]
MCNDKLRCGIRKGGNPIVLFGSYVDMASVLLRLTVGTLFMIHGYAKLTSQRQGSWMKNMGMPTALVPFAGFVEFFGGLGLLLGILTPIIALLSALWMLSTTWFAITKLKKKYMGGYELDITLLLAALALTFLGGGAFSIDRLIGL